VSEGYVNLHPCQFLIYTQLKA